MKECKRAYIQSVGSPGPEQAALQNGQSGFAGLPAEAWRLHPRLHANPEEAEFGVAESGARAPDQWH
jgi:hypothetical protein